LHNFEDWNRDNTSISEAGAGQDILLWGFMMSFAAKGKYVVNGSGFINVLTHIVSIWANRCEVDSVISLLAALLINFHKMMWWFSLYWDQNGPNIDVYEENLECMDSTQLFSVECLVPYQEESASI
jgi:hypothetical protein